MGHLTVLRNIFSFGADRVQLLRSWGRDHRVDSRRPGSLPVKGSSRSLERGFWVEEQGRSYYGPSTGVGTGRKQGLYVKRNGK